MRPGVGRHFGDLVLRCLEQPPSGFDHAVRRRARIALISSDREQNVDASAAVPDVEHVHRAALGGRDSAPRAARRRRAEPRRVGIPRHAGYRGV